MSGTLIHNPQGAFKTGVDYRIGSADDGPLQLGVGEAYQFRANADVEAGEAVMFVAATATVPLSVTPMTTAADEQLYAGAAQNDAATGESVVVVRTGFARIQHDTSDTPAFGNILELPDATTGDFAVSTADAVANTAGVGLVLGIEDPDVANVCFAYLGWVPAPDLII